jgi:hypothetical protein
MKKMSFHSPSILIFISIKIIRAITIVATVGTVVQYYYCMYCTTYVESTVLRYVFLLNDKNYVKLAVSSVIH